MAEVIDTKLIPIELDDRKEYVSLFIENMRYMFASGGDLGKKGNLCLTGIILYIIDNGQINTKDKYLEFKKWILQEKFVTNESTLAVNKSSLKIKGWIHAPKRNTIVVSDVIINMIKSRKITVSVTFTGKW
jgi:hypothetical protein